MRAQSPTLCRPKSGINGQNGVRLQKAHPAARGINQISDSRASEVHVNRHAFFKGEVNNRSGNRKVLQAHTGAVKEGDLVA